MRKIGNALALTAVVGLGVGGVHWADELQFGGRKSVDTVTTPNAVNTPTDNGPVIDKYRATKNDVLTQAVLYYRLGAVAILDAEDDGMVFRVVCKKGNLVLSDLKIQHGNGNEVDRAGMIPDGTVIVQNDPSLCSPDEDIFSPTATAKEMLLGSIMGIRRAIQLTGLETGVTTG